MESPTYFGLLQVLESNGLKALELPTDPVNGIKVEALEAGQRYWCECHAWNNMPHSGAPQSALSRRGVIRIASKSP